MKWQPFIQFRTGHDQGSWNRLTPAEQKAIYAASGKKRKPKPPAVEEDECNEISWLPTMHPVRVVGLDELRLMPRFELYW
jgi:hypothetical protein